MKRERDKQWADYYDQVNILDELLEEPAEFRLGEQLRRDILSKKRKRKLQNITIKGTSNNSQFVTPAKAGVQLY